MSAPAAVPPASPSRPAGAATPRPSLRGRAGRLAALRAGIAAVAALPALALPARAPACAFDAWLPPLTLVDRLFDADALAMAAADPSDPTRWRLVAAPAPISMSSEAPDPAAFLAAGADARPPHLRADEVVLFAHDPVDDVWRRLDTLDRSTRPAIQKILAEAAEWQDPLDPARWVLASRLLNSRDARLQTLALRELDRAPWPDLRATYAAPDAPRLDAAALGASLRDPANASLEPIHALLIGLSHAPEAKTLVEARLAALSREPGPVPAMGAWAVAAIELGGPAAVDALGERVAKAPADQMPAATLAPLVEALAVQAEAAAPETRERILAAATAALEARPDLAGCVARSFGARFDYAMGPGVEAALRLRRALPAAEAIAAAGYVFAARQAAKAGDEAITDSAWAPD